MLWGQEPGVVSTGCDNCTKCETVSNPALRDTWSANTTWLLVISADQAQRPRRSLSALCKHAYCCCPSEQGDAFLLFQGNKDPDTFQELCTLLMHSISPWNDASFLIPALAQPDFCRHEVDAGSVSFGNEWLCLSGGRLETQPSDPAGNGKVSTEFSKRHVLWRMVSIVALFEQV